MADKIRVNTGRLGSDADRIQGYVNNIIKELHIIQDHVEAMVKMWEGPAKKTFYQAFVNDMQAMEAEVKHMQEIYLYDRSAKKTYETCEQKVAAMIAEIKV